MENNMCLLKGTALMQAICQQAFKTFGKDLPEHAMKHNLNGLAGLLSNVRAKDVNLRESVLKADETFVGGQSSNKSSDTAPTCFIHIDENPIFSFSIFVLRNGGVLPMHDHPGMHGVIKVIQGKVRIRCLSASKGKHTAAAAASDRPQIHAHVITDAFVTAGSDPCILTPTEGNFHQVWSVNGPAAFMDILSPPYARLPYIEGPDCRYYKETELHSGQSILEEIPCPDEYWCDQAHYEGPPLYESPVAAAQAGPAFR